MSSTALAAAKPCSRTERFYDERDLLPYQLRIVEHIQRHLGSLLFVDMGLGKTVATLTALQQLKDANKIKKVLVVAPLRVAAAVWPAEIDVWRHVSLSYSLAIGTEKQRIDALTKRTADVYIINRENVPWLVESINCWPFDTVVIDESTSFKNPASRRFKALKKVRSLIKRCILLTGTPAPNSYMDLWSQVFLADQGERLEKTFYKYRNKYFFRGFSLYQWHLKEGAKKLIEAKLHDVCLVLRSSDFGELPPVTHNRIKVQLTKDAQKKYQKLSNQFLLSFGDSAITAINAAVLAGKLLQFASGAAYLDDGTPVRIHNEKIKALKELVADYEHENFLVAYHYKHSLERLVEAFPDAVILDKNPSTIERWNRGEIRILLAHPASAGHGLNLQRGGSKAVWFDLTYSLELYQQFNARLHRKGQDQHVVIHYLVSKNTIDEDVMRRLAQKGDTQTSLIQVLKRRQEDALLGAKF